MILKLFSLRIFCFKHTKERVSRHRKSMFVYSYHCYDSKLVVGDLFEVNITVYCNITRSFIYAKCLSKCLSVNCALERKERVNSVTTKKQMTKFSSANFQKKN